MKILVVDDSATIRKRIRTELESNGHEVVEAPSGDAALEQLAEVNPDLITLDVDMPGSDGYETCYRIRKGQGTPASDVPIIFITANDTVQSRQKGYQAGGNEYMAKPFMRGELKLAIGRALKTRDNLRGHTVLVVDDSSAILGLLKVGLAAKGLNVIKAESGARALEIIKCEGSKIDLVITDYLMPEMNGDELCTTIRHELGYQELPVIFLSGMAEKDQILKMFRAGASDFIVKPFSMDEVQARVAVHINAKVLGDQLRGNVRELKKAHSMKDKFLSICSHDLRAPLAGIDGLTDLILMDETLSEENQEYLQLIKSSSEFLFSIISDLLELGRAESDNASIDLAPTDLETNIKACVLNLQHLASPKKIELKTDFSQTAQGTQLVLGNQNSLKRIFNNLISNSIKFSHPESTVTIKLTQDEDARQVRVAVSDQGIGIPADKIEGLFDPTQKTSQVGTSGEQSFGLGMVIVKKLVDQHSGNIEVQSEKNVGTTITVSFPFA